MPHIKPRRFEIGWHNRLRTMEKDEILKLFSQLVEIESISTDPSRFNAVLKAVSFLKHQLEKIGCTVRLLKKNHSPPLVIGVLKGKGSKTIGIYGHYDVQPEDPVEEWKTLPFKLNLKDGKFYGRGVADNKGHIIQNLSSIKHLIKEKKLKNNIIFIFEGEEETSSANFETYVKKVRDLLNKVDVFYITDMGMHKKNQPQIFYGLRGIVYFELEIKIGERDLHSGVYGNMVFNPINILADLIAKIKDIRTGKILIPNFYQSVNKPDNYELELLKKTVKSDSQQKAEAQVFGLPTGDGSSSSLAPKISPSFDCHGISAGYTAEGTKTVIPRSARVKFSFRLVADQNPDEIEKLAQQFIFKNLPQGIKYHLKTTEKSPCFYMKTNNDYIKKTAQALTSIFGGKTLFNRSGGSIAAAEILQRLFKKPVILTGFTLPDDNIHAPNENFDEEMFWKGIKVLEKIYSQ